MVNQLLPVSFSNCIFLPHQAPHFCGCCSKRHLATSYNISFSNCRSIKKSMFSERSSTFQYVILTPPKCTQMADKLALEIKKSLRKLFKIIT